MAQQAQLIAYRDQVIQQRNGEIAQLQDRYQHGSELHKAVFMALSSWTGGDTFDDGVRGLIAELKELRACPVWLPTRYSIEAGDGPGIYPEEDPQGEWCKVAEVGPIPDDKLLVTSAALRTVLEALIGPSHHIRELLATREPPELFPENPINLLIAEFNNPGSR